MKNSYSLTEEPFAIEPFTPHDFVVKQLIMTKDELAFIFEDDVTYHDGIKELFPGKKTLIMRFHICDNDLSAYREKKMRFPWQKDGYVTINAQKLADYCGKNLTFIKQYFSYRAVIIELGSPAVGGLRIEAQTDRVEYEWVE